MQASVWRDKKQVAWIHYVDVIPPSKDTHKVLRMSRKSKRQKEVDSPRVISSMHQPIMAWRERRETHLTGLTTSRPTDGSSDSISEW
jgi:hypothetical protein